MAVSGNNSADEPEPRVVTSVELQMFRQICNDAIASRNRFIQELLGRNKNVNDECDYPHDPVDTDTYYQLFDREGIANRVVKVLPEECWQVMPSIYENEDGTRSSVFEKAVKSLPDSMVGEENHHDDDNLSIIWNTMKQGDIDSRKGYYGAIYIGFDDNKDPSLPAVYKEGQKVLWLLSLPDKYCKISKLNGNMFSSRFGLPDSYTITFDSTEQQPGLITTQPATITRQVEVHWTRIIHISEGRTWHTPAMQPNLNRLLDVRKLYGGSAEMYWRGAFPGISFETDPSLGGMVPLNFEATRNSIEDYFNGLQRYFALNGMTAKSLTPQVVDPSKQIDVQIVAICIQLGIPKRIFMGSERGELASSQDDAAWNDRLRERQNSYITAKIITPFFNRLINMGVLPKPKNGYKVFWPDLTSQTNEEKSSVALKLMQSLAQYLSSGGDMVITPFDFLTTVWKLSEREANNIIKRAESHITDNAGSSQFTPALNPPTAQNLSPNKISNMPQGSPNPNKPANTNQPMKPPTNGQ